MGVNTTGNKGSGKTIFNVYGGELTLQDTDRERLVKKLQHFNQDLEHIKERTISKGKHEGKTAYYYEFWDVSGQLTAVNTNQTDWGTNLVIELTDVDETYAINLNGLYGAHSKDFIRRLGNLDPDLEITFGVWQSEAENGKTYSGVKMYQAGEKVPYDISFDDLPAPKEKKRRGKAKSEWDFSDQEDFLYDTLMDWLNEHFPEDGDGDQPNTGSKPAPQPPAEDDDDLPF